MNLILNSEYLLVLKKKSFVFKIRLVLVYEEGDIFKTYREDLAKNDAQFCEFFLNNNLPILRVCGICPWCTFQIRKEEGALKEIPIFLLPSQLGFSGPEELSSENSIENRIWK